jgi:hypothetical protein
MNLHPNGTRVKYQPDPRREDATHAGHTGTVIYLTTDGFHRVNWDAPTPDDTYFNLGRVFRIDSLVKIGFDGGPRCEQPGGCEGISILNADEKVSPVHCLICERIICDTCAAHCRNIPMSEIPASAFIDDKKPDEPACGGYVCTNHFNEEWV